MTAILAMAAFAALFAAFGLLRPADRATGCHACSHAAGGDCGTECPLLKDALDTKHETERAS
jgi:hypothetical protein